MERLKPLGNGSSVMKSLNFNKEQLAFINRVTKKAKKKHLWESSQNYVIDPQNLETWAYWIYKTENPILEPMKNYNIKEQLKPYKKTHFEFVDEHFQSERKITMSMVGDLMSTHGLEVSKNKLYEDVSSLIFDSDICYANLESTFATGEKKGFEIKAGSTPLISLNSAQYETIIGHNSRRYDVVQLSNNHILDDGEAGIRATVAQLEKDQVLQTGVNLTREEAITPRVTNLGGIKIGWVAHTFSVNFKPFPEDKPWIVNMTPFHLEESPDISRIINDIKACREEGCDLVVVTPHWGLEFEFYPHPDQLKWARLFAEAGADAIVGHHPHVIQPVEIIYPENIPGKAVPVVYSMGNLTSLFAHPFSVLSLIARFTIETGQCGASQQTRITELSLTPVAIVEEVGNDTNSLRIITVSELVDTYSNKTNPNLDTEMSEYVEKIAFYANHVLGSSYSCRHE